MLCYKELYGCDADGNRGVPMVSYEIEAEDKDDIVEALYDVFLEGETTGTQVILLYCHIVGEDIEVEVEIDEYIEDLIAKADADEDVKNDEDMQEWLQELKNEIIVYNLIAGAKKGYKYLYENKAIEILPQNEQIDGDAKRGYISINKNGFVRVPAKKIERVKDEN